MPRVHAVYGRPPSALPRIGNSALLTVPDSKARKSTPFQIRGHTVTERAAIERIEQLAFGAYWALLFVFQPFTPTTASPRPSEIELLQLSLARATTVL